jgi:uncharacterized protein YyaL (SSP411 family)
MAAVAWLAWNAETFARARAEGKPVLLSLAPAWCQHAQQMDRQAYADERVAALINGRFVPVRVDADRRPDLGCRYGLGGWPTTACLTPDGDVLAGGTYAEADRLGDVLERVADAFHAGRHVRPRPNRAFHTDPAAGRAATEDLVEQIAASFDAAHGGFGDSPKFPHAAPVRLALDLCKESGSDRFHDIAVTSLDAMGWGPLSDERDGGFFRCSDHADWSRPNEEKLLDVNASLLSLYVHAFETLGIARYGDRAAGLLRYLQTGLADQVDGGWYGSQREPDDVDRTLFTDWNAHMVSAALEAGRVLGDPSVSEFAVRSLERVVLLTYAPGAGVAHYFDGEARIRGLLEDHVAMAAAQLDAFEATGNIAYEMMAEELALYCIRTMWDQESGGFFDRIGDPRRDWGLLRQAVKPFCANCLAARVLRRLSRTAESGEFDEYADRTIDAMASRAAAEGPLAADYVLAVRHTAR